jgi:RNA polymerase sigma-70 factor (ECF subfamily)
MSTLLCSLPVEREATPLELEIWKTRSLMISLCQRMLNKYPDAQSIAEDLVSEAIIRALKSQESFRSDCKVSSWMYRITSNVVMDYIRRVKSKKNLLHSFLCSSIDDIILNPDRNEAFANNHSEENLIWQLDGSQAWKLVQLLPPLYGVVIKKRLRYDYKFEEISAQLRIPLSTTKTRYWRGLEILNKAWAEQQAKVPRLE